MNTAAATHEPVYHPRDDVLFTPLDESQGVLLSLSAGQYYTLNETGSLVWQALRDGATLAEVARALEAEFEVGPGEALAHARAFVDELLREGLIRQEP
jgi:coenzyme PQQ synthesis protein D (PqqD)